MLRVFASRVGRRAAAIAALLYLACVVMPSVALALVPDAVSAYCFDEIADEIAALQAKSAAHAHVHGDGTVHVHVHSDGTVHVHNHAGAAHHAQNEDQGGAAGQRHSHSHPGTHDANCCGAFGFVGVLPVLNDGAVDRVAYHIQQPIRSDCLVGCSPQRINRPPIISLPM